MLGLKLGCIGGGGRKGGYKRGEIGLGYKKRRQGGGEGRAPPRSGQGTVGWTRLQEPEGGGSTEILGEKEELGSTRPPEPGLRMPTGRRGGGRGPARGGGGRKSL